jgi:imidazolonepropionase-like amidohydrolase
MKADLVLLRENPLDDIRNIGSIETVVKNGHVLDRERLDQILEDLAAR